MGTSSYKLKLLAHLRTSLRLGVLCVTDVPWRIVCRLCRTRYEVLLHLPITTVYWHCRTAPEIGWSRRVYVCPRCYGAHSAKRRGRSAYDHWGTVPVVHVDYDSKPFTLNA